MGGTCSTLWEMINTNIIFVAQPERNILLGRKRHRWNNNIKLYLEKFCLWIGFIWLGMGTCSECL